MDMPSTVPHDPVMDVRQRRTREALSAALLALLAEKPFDELTIREIAARADVGYATYYRHYPTREALLSHVASSEIAKLLQLVIPMLSAEESYPSVLALCRHVEAHRNLWSALLTGSAADVMRGEFVRQTAELARAFGGGDRWVPDELVAVLASGGTIDILAWSLAQRDPLPAERVATIIEGLIVAPLFDPSRTRLTD